METLTVVIRTSAISPVIIGTLVRSFTIIAKTSMRLLMMIVRTPTRSLVTFFHNSSSNDCWQSYWYSSILNLLKLCNNGILVFILYHWLGFEMTFWWFEKIDQKRK